MDDVFVVKKEIGETPLAVIERVRLEKGIDTSVRMAYAGRLDPMADGLLLLLVGDACDRRKEFESLEKAYEFEILLGVETDTYDVMGIVQTDEFPVGELDSFELASCGLDQVRAQLESFVGTFEQAYPPYSSARVDGHPLFWWARAGRLGEITMPTHAVTVSEATVSSMRTQSLESVVETIQKRIGQVTQGEFRQAEILSRWKHLLTRSAGDLMMPVFTAQITCSSGTYVRSICHDIGQRLGYGAIAYRITRTRIGSYRL